MKQKTILESFLNSTDLSLRPLFEELQSNLFNPSQKTNYLNTTPEELGLPLIQEIIPIGTIYCGGINLELLPYNEEGVGIYTSQ